MEQFRKRTGGTRIAPSAVRLTRTAQAIALCVASVLLFMAPTRTAAQTLSLGQAANYGVFELSGSNGSLSASGDSIYGNVALDNTTNNNKDTFSGATVTGSVALGGRSVQYSISGGHVPTPSIVNLSAANASAISASATAAGFTPEKTYGTIASATTISGNSAFNVFNLSGINLSGANLTIHGTASETFVFNVSGSLVMSGASIVLTGGVTANNVIFNVLGSGGTRLSGSTLNGTILDVGSAISLSGATINGAVLSEKQISISGGTINVDPFAAADPPTAPEPATIAMACLGCLAILGRTALCRWQRSCRSM